MTCHEFNKFLCDYQADELIPEQYARCEAHRARCSSCAASLSSYALTIRLAKGAFSHPDTAVPEKVPEVLMHAILAARLWMQR
jgi:hypothetical protein